MLRFITLCIPHKMTCPSPQGASGAVLVSGQTNIVNGEHNRFSAAEYGVTGTLYHLLPRLYIIPLCTDTGRRCSLF